MISLLALAYVPPAPVVRRPFRSRALGMGTQVITDIDDTIKSSGGVAIPLGDEAQIYLGGVDTSYARNAFYPCLLYTSPSPRDKRQSRMPSSA